jgi:rare lipoprotein A (peptidoglycan hydrolase)
MNIRNIIIPFALLLFSFTSDMAVVYTATWYDTENHLRVRREHSTAAFNSYPKGTMLLVTNAQNGKSDTVEVTDRHNAGTNHIDLSKTSFCKIANLKQGRIKVLIQKIN